MVIEMENVSYRSRLRNPVSFNWSKVRDTNMLCHPSKVSPQEGKEHNDSLTEQMGKNGPWINLD